MRLVRASGGAPSLAHPASLRMAPDALLVVRAAASRGAAWAGSRCTGPITRRSGGTPSRRSPGGTAWSPTGGSDFHRLDEPLRPGDTGDPPLPLDAIDAPPGRLEPARHPLR